MHVFIDESGSFTGYHDRSVSVVGALAIPSGKLPKVRGKYGKIRPQLPKEKGEVKGRLLNEEQVDAVVTILRRNEALFEITAIDLGFQNEEEILRYRQQHGDEMLSRVSRFREPDRSEVERASKQILTTSAPLYLQAITTFEVIKTIIDHVPMYFSQRQPHELGQFIWKIDGKEPKKTTNWEMWWSWFAVGALSTMSRTRPQPVLEGADFSHYDVFKTTGGGEEGTDTRLLLADLSFSSSIEPELELVDIVVNATRRALMGTLGPRGFSNISSLMIHRPEPYIQFLLLKGDGVDRRLGPSYGPIVRNHFSSGGRSMLSPHFLKQAAAEDC